MCECGHQRLYCWASGMMSASGKWPQCNADAANDEHQTALYIPGRVAHCDGVDTHLHEVDGLSDAVLVLQETPVAPEAQEHVLGVLHVLLQPFHALPPSLPGALRRRLAHDQLCPQVLSLGAAAI